MNIFTTKIREKLLKQGINNANKLNASAVPYVSAKGQVKILDKLTKDDFLTEEEFKKLEEKLKHISMIKINTSSFQK